MVVDWIQTSSLDEYPGRLSTTGSSTSDPLQNLQSMIDFYLQVHEAAELYGQCMFAGVTKFLDPTVHILPTTLSDTEHTLITSALWLLKIFHQLRYGLFDPKHTQRTHFADGFIKHLHPWQIDQVISLERKLQLGEYPEDLLLGYASHTNTDLANRLLQTRYIESLNPSSGSLRHAPRFESAARMSQRNPTDWPHTSGNVGPAAEASSITTRLRNHIWISTQCASESNSVLRTNRFRGLCLHLGLFFWDHARLDHWRIADAEDLIASADDVHYNLAHEASNTPPLSHKQKCQNTFAQAKERQIIEWVRSGTVLDMREWLHLKMIEARIEQDEESFPLRFVMPGLVCRRCGLDGHRRARCCPQTWHFADRWDDQYEYDLSDDSE